MHFTWFLYKNAELTLLLTSTDIKILKRWFYPDNESVDFNFNVCVKNVWFSTSHFAQSQNDHWITYRSFQTLSTSNSIRDYKLIIYDCHYQQYNRKFVQNICVFSRCCRVKTRNMYWECGLALLFKDEASLNTADCGPTAVPNVHNINAELLPEAKLCWDSWLYSPGRESFNNCTSILALSHDSNHWAITVRWFK